MPPNRAGFEGGKKGAKSVISRSMRLNLFNLPKVQTGLQNLYAPVRSRPAPPIPQKQQFQHIRPVFNRHRLTSAERQSTAPWISGAAEIRCGGGSTARPFKMPV